MKQTELRNWKKVFESDLSYIVYEMKDLIETPAMIILEGPLGSGKTTFTKCFVDGGDTVSPSYSVVTETKDIVHADFYRIKDREEIIHLELPLYLENKNYFFAEWGKKHLESINKELPDDFKIYSLEISINESISTNSIESRNFTLIELIP